MLRYGVLLFPNETGRALLNIDNQDAALVSAEFRIDLREIDLAKTKCLFTVKKEHPLVLLVWTEGRYKIVRLVQPNKNQRSICRIVLMSLFDAKGNTTFAKLPTSALVKNLEGLQLFTDGTTILADYFPGRKPKGMCFGSNNEVRYVRKEEAQDCKLGYLDYAPVFDENSFMSNWPPALTNFHRQKRQL